MESATEKPVKQAGWLRWLHTIGYVTTAIVTAELLMLPVLVVYNWLQVRKDEAAQIDRSRTHEGPLQSHDDSIVVGSAAYLFKQLPPSPALHGDGLRFVAMPSFNRSHFAVAIFMPKPDAAEAEGVLARFDWQNRYAPLGQRQFRMPAAAYRSLAAKMDKLTDNWPGDPAGLCLDGEPIAFERVRGSRVTSGIGNCDQHYWQVGHLMWNYLRQFAPGSDLPSRGNWEPTDKG